MKRLAGLAASAGLVAWGMASVAAPGCTGTSPTPFNEDAGAPAAGVATLTVGFSGTGTGTVNLVSDGVAADASNGNATCATACTERYPTTATVNLTATAADDSVFDGWDPATSDPSCPTVSMAANITCTATFQKQAVTPDAGDDAGTTADAAGDGPSDAGDGGG